MMNRHQEFRRFYRPVISTTQVVTDGQKRLCPRFYCQNLPAPNKGEILSGHRVELDSQQVCHAQRVLRLNAGDTVELFDGLDGWRQSGGCA